MEGRCVGLSHPRLPSLRVFVPRCYQWDRSQRPSGLGVVGPSASGGVVSSGGFGASWGCMCGACTTLGVVHAARSPALPVFALRASPAHSTTAGIRGYWPSCLCCMGRVLMLVSGLSLLALAVVVAIPSAEFAIQTQVPAFWCHRVHADFERTGRQVHAIGSRVAVRAPGLEGDGGSAAVWCIGILGVGRSGRCRWRCRRFPSHGTGWGAALRCG
jgi:hypothetical protein